MKLKALEKSIVKKINSLNTRHDKAVAKQFEIENKFENYEDKASYQNAVSKQWDLSEIIDEKKEDLKVIEKVLTGKFSRVETDYLRGYEIQEDIEIDELDELEEKAKNKKQIVRSSFTKYTDMILKKHYSELNYVELIEFLHENRASNCFKWGSDDVIVLESVAKGDNREISFKTTTNGYFKLWSY